MGPRGRTGRPPIFGPDICERIVELVRLGNYLETAAACVGIDRVTLRLWLTEGAKSKSAAYEDFLLSVRKAQGEAEARDLAKIDMATEWQAAAWRLERRAPDRWGRRVRLDQNVVTSDATEQPARVSWSEVLEAAVGPDTDDDVLELGPGDVQVETSD